MNLNGLKQKTMKYMGIFFGFMLVCTLVSRGIYGMCLAQITQETPKKMSLTKEFSQDGSISSATQEAVWTQSDLRVEQVYVKAGETVEAGTPLMKLEAASIQEKIDALQTEIDQMQAQMSAAESNAAKQAKERQTAMDRAAADLNQAILSGDQTVAQASGELSAAQAALDALGEKKEYRKAAEEKDTGYQKILTDENSTKAERKAAKKKVDDAADLEWESKKQELEAAVAEKQSALSSAQAARNQAETAGKRSVEDAAAQPEADAAATVDGMTLEQKQTKQKKYQEQKQAGGIIAAASAGVVDSVNVKAGDLTPVSACFILQTAGASLEFHVNFTKEQEKLVQQNSPVVLKFRDGSRYDQGTVDSVTKVSDETGADAYDLGVTLPAGVASIGDRAELTYSTTTEVYDCCVPKGALRRDSATDYVYLVRQKETILGTEYSVVRQQVKILDQNDSYAALDASSGVTAEDMVVTDVSGSLADGGTVRLKE